MDETNQQRSLKQWQGYRLYAVDGCRIRLPNEPIIRERFGSQGNGNVEQSCPMALASACYDVMNDQVVDAKMAASWSSEREMALDHLKSLSEPNALVLYDRGYPAFWLMKAHQESAIDFCMRVPWNQFNEARDFHQSGKRQKIVTIKPSKTAKALCHTYKVSDRPMKVRFIRVDLPDTVEILVTSVTDRKRIHRSDFKDLYHQRWRVEETFKRLKSRLEVENFTGKSPLAVQQDFHAKVVTYNLAALLSQAAQPLVDKATKRCKHRHGVNQAQALSRLKRCWLTLFQQSADRLASVLDQLIVIVSQCREIIRPDRQFDRKRVGKKKARYPVAYKRTL